MHPDVPLMTRDCHPPPSGLAHEQQESLDPIVARKAKESMELVKEAEGSHRAKKVVIDEEGTVVDENSVHVGEVRRAD